MLLIGGSAFFYLIQFYTPGSQINELLFSITFSMRMLPGDRERAPPALKALGRAWKQQWIRSGQDMSKRDGVYRALLDPWTMLSTWRNTDGNIFNKNALQTLTQQSGSSNPKKNNQKTKNPQQSYHLRKRLFTELLVHSYCCAQCFSHPSISNPLTAIWVSTRVALAGLHFWFLIFSGCQNTSCQIQVNRLKTQMSILDLSFPYRLDMLVTLKCWSLLPRPPSSSVSRLLPVTLTAPTFCEHRFLHRLVWHSTGTQGTWLQFVRVKSKGFTTCIPCITQCSEDQRFLTCSAWDWPEAGGFKIWRKYV